MQVAVLRVHAAWRGDQDGDQQLTFDGATRDPMQQAVRDALIAFMAATSQAQAEATKAAQRAGIEHARQNDQRAYLGRKPSYTREQLDKVRAMLSQEAMGIA